MNECICCHNKLIKHYGHQRVYWFCPSCHQEMPNLDIIYLNSKINSSRKIDKFKLIKEYVK